MVIVIAETMKLIGNFNYGKLITNKEKHHDIVYVDESKIGAEIMDEHFYGLTELPNDLYREERRDRDSIVFRFNITLNNITLVIIHNCK